MFTKYNFNATDFIPRTFDDVFCSKEVTPFEAIVILYDAVSDGKAFKQVHIPWELEDYAKFTYEANGFSTDLIIADLELQPVKYPIRKDVILTFFTGGKDSFSSYVKYSHLRDIDINFFIKGLNTLYPNEWKNALEIAKKLNIELDICSVKLPKTVNQPENPIKNAMTYVLATERYRFIPSLFSFGYTSGFYSNNQNELIENDENELVKEKLIEHYIETDGELLQSAGVQCSMVSGDTSTAGFLFNEFYEFAYGIKEETGGCYDEVEAYRWMEAYGFGQLSSSCMTSVQWKKGHRDRLNKLYSLVVEGKNLIAGTVSIKNTEKDYEQISIFELEERLKTGAVTIVTKGKSKSLKVIKAITDIKDLKLEDVFKKDFIGPYEDGCCFKCAERYIVYANHFGYRYKDGFISYSLESILRLMAKTKDTTNNNDMTHYVQNVLKAKLIDVPKEFRSPRNKNYIGEKALSYFL